MSEDRTSDRIFGMRMIWVRLEYYFLSLAIKNSNKKRRLATYLGPCLNNKISILATETRLKPLQKLIISLNLFLQFFQSTVYYLSPPISVNTGDPQASTPTAWVMFVVFRLALPTINTGLFGASTTGGPTL